ncbi:MAG: hypothetical protein D0433_08770 [Candidatus Thermochlorobacter aerophilum]|uniref:Phosphohydrolase-associated domain-containing protein n=1 Tax=Candidatus Thermochlorobacter aerophilus TaxID=1868324 RepID=A0A395M0W8_9BACT|nr:MAG: hypothetical protein D0433_08770 [Candidatus Thermochlorobacter aerophilum]
MRPDEPLTEVARHRVIRRLINGLVTDLLTESSRRIDALLRACGGQVSVDDVRRWPTPLIGYPPETEQMNRALKQFLYAHMYTHPHTQQMAAQAEQVLSDLFATYLRRPEQLPESARARLDELPLPRVVCDYIAGMTDRFALRAHAELIGRA